MDIEQIRKMYNDASSGTDKPNCAWSVLDDLRSMFGDEVVDAGLADGSITVYDLVDEDA